MAKKDKEVKVEEVVNAKKETEKPHRIRDFLYREYRGENAVMLFLSLFAIVLGALIVTQKLTISEEYFLLGYKKGKLFAWILIGLSSIALIFILIPFYRPSISELKHLKPNSKADFFRNVARTLVFTICLTAFFILCDLGLDPLMKWLTK